MTDQAPLSSLLAARCCAELLRIHILGGMAHPRDREAASLLVMDHLLECAYGDGVYDVSYRLTPEGELTICRFICAIHPSNALRDIEVTA